MRSGDPLRAKFVAEHFLEDVHCYNEVRGMYGYTGRYKGVPVSVQGTGMGNPTEKARELLASTEESVQSISEQVGILGAAEP